MAETGICRIDILTLPPPPDPDYPYPFRDPGRRFEFPTIRCSADVTADNIHEVRIKDKFDRRPMYLLIAVDPHIWTSLVPGFLSWVGDLNGPNCRAIFDLLTSNDVTIEATIPLVAEILSLRPGGVAEPERAEIEERQVAVWWSFVGALGLHHQLALLPALKLWLRQMTDKFEADWEVTEDLRGRIKLLETYDERVVEGRKIWMN